MSVADSTPSNNRSVFYAVLGLTLAVSAGVVATVTLQLRGRLREQVLRHEAETIRAVATMQLANGAARLERAGLTDVPGELLAAVLETSKLSGVIAVRVFDAARGFAGAAPWAWSETPPAASDWTLLVAGEAVANLHPRESLALFAGGAAEPKAGEAAVPLLEIWVPLRRADGAAFLGAAQFWSDGRVLHERFAAVDRRLVEQAIVAWLAGALVTTAALGWALRKIRAAHAALTARGEDLLRANRELVLAAKTSALGSVTAHLIHELKNPVAGLESYVASQAEAAGRDGTGDELAAATGLARRLRTMIDDVVGVLRDEQHGTSFQLTGAEVAELALAKVRDVARAQQVTLAVELRGAFALPGRAANLAGLVVRNLLQNAIEATPAGRAVTLSGGVVAEGVEFLVADGGAGLPPTVAERLFQPCTSTKRGGSGLGLALSYQLAQQAGGQLELVQSGATGTTFRLMLRLER
ncbi:MAG: hypothetical protein RLZZ15_1136 [Verrucomicrobiota bacterium]|jgi:signal transduction histidine kinase